MAATVHQATVKPVAGPTVASSGHRLPGTRWKWRMAKKSDATAAAGSRRSVAPTSWKTMPRKTSSSKKAMRAAETRASASPVTTASAVAGGRSVAMPVASWPATRAATMAVPATNQASRPTDGSPRGHAGRGWRRR